MGEAGIRISVGIISGYFRGIAFRASLNCLYNAPII